MDVRQPRDAAMLDELNHSRVVIEQAKGILAHHAGLRMDQAFDMMRAYARNTNRRLAEVARALAEATLDPGTVASARPNP